MYGNWFLYLCYMEGRLKYNLYYYPLFPPPQYLQTICIN
nr:MAG TPA: hypothetical protein [Caudoviricetes sp.]